MASSYPITTKGPTVPLYVTREQYFTAAKEILLAQGFRGLKMTALHRHLGVSSGSFYNYFKNWPDFVQQFLDHWAGQTDEIAEKASVPLDAFERLELLRQLAQTVPHDVEAAIRTWSTVEPLVAQAQQNVDQQRRALIRRAVVEATGGEQDADQLAEFILSLIVGCQQLTKPVDVRAMDAMLARSNAMIARIAQS